jgi:Cof subfamily protein (haloacid dehalogenase superfamily)
MSKTLKDFQALLFDVDNTLTNTSRSIPESTAQVLALLSQQNFKLGVCTSRYFAALKDLVFPLFPEESLHILCGGAQIMTREGAIVWEENLSAEITQEICRKADELHQRYLLPIGKLAFANDAMIASYSGIHPLAPQMTPLSEIPNWNTPILSIRDVSPEFSTYLEQRGDVSLKKLISFSGVPSIDITAKKIHKAVAVQKWCELQGITPADVIGFGDSENDVEFLQLVGHSVAMGNALDIIKQVAKRTIGHADEDGLSLYLNDLLKGSAV